MTQLYFLQHETHQQQETNELEWTSIILKYITELSSDKIPSNVRVKKTSQGRNKATIIGKSYTYLEQQTGELYGINRKKKKIKITMQQYKNQSQIGDGKPQDGKLHPWLEWNIILEDKTKLKSGIIIMHTEEIRQIPTNLKRYLTKDANNLPTPLPSNSIKNAHKDIADQLTKKYKALENFDTKKEAKSEEPLETWKRWILNECIKKYPQYCFSLVKKNISHLVKIAISTLIGYFLSYGYIYVILTIVLLLYQRPFKRQLKRQIRASLSVANIANNYVQLGFEYLTNVKKSGSSRLKKNLERVPTKNEKIKNYNIQKRGI